MSQIDDYSNYLIYNNGAVYSKKRKVFIKPRQDKNGYLRVDICSNTHKRKTFKIHQLVAIAYLNHNLENTDYVIYHIDSDINNNYLHNLQIITKAQNSRKKNVNRKSGLPSGVYFTGKHYFCLIVINGVKIRFNKFKTLQEASDKHNEIYNALMKGVKFS